MIELKNITKKYDRKVLDNVNLKLDYGKIYILKGISGSGKTTLLNIIGGIDNNYEGTYTLDNENIKKLKNKNQFRKKIGYVFQQSLLISHLSIKDNLLLIKNDYKLVEELSKTFGLQSLLNKMPSELSIGERERVSIIRAIISNPKIIIADEPTASLDKTNASKIVNYFKQIKTKNRIIIISTHSNIFDCVADEIINIKYGKVEEIKQRNFIKCNDITLDNSKTKQFPIDFKYSISRYLANKSKISCIFQALLFLIILSCISLKLNFKKEYMNYLYRKYPFTTLSLEKENYNYMCNKYECSKYENYIFADNENEYYILLPKQETVIGKKEYMYKGKYPQNSNEVIVNYKYYKENLKDNDIENKEIIIKNKKYKIVGVLTNDDMYLNDIYESNSYYNKEDTNQIFIPYEEMQKEFKDEKKSSNEIMVTIREKIDDELYTDLKYNSSYWYKKIGSNIYLLNTFLNLFFVGLIFISILSFIFIANNIYLNIYFRKREIGCLQLFGLSKKRIKRIFIFEYCFKYIFGLFVSIISFQTIMLLIKHIYKLDFSINQYIMIIFIALIITYSYLLSYIPLRKYIKKDIKELIYTY